MLRRGAFILALTTAWVSCKHAAPVATSAVKDFDASANDKLRIMFDDDHSFCADAPRFSAVNAYWLGLASAYAYASKARIKEAEAMFAAEMQGLTASFISSAESSSALEPSTQAVWIQSDKLAILAFRGTPLDRVDKQNITTDLRADLVPFAVAGNGSVHHGFQDGLASVWSQVQARLDQLGDRRLFVTGHSLGAGLATLTAARIALDPALKSVRPNLRGLYTIGSPRVGDETFVTQLARAAAETRVVVARMRNGQDIVTRVPGGAYRDFGPMLVIAGDGRIYTDDDGLGLPRYPKLTGALAESLRMDWRGTELSDLVDHFPVDYFSKLAVEFMIHKAWAKKAGVAACDDDAFYQMPQLPPEKVTVSRLEELLPLGPQQLESLFMRGTAGPIPSKAQGGLYAIGDGNVPGSVSLSTIANSLWEGKVFRTNDGGETTLTNRLFNDAERNFTAVATKIDKSLSFPDGGPAILLNYEHSVISPSPILAAKLGLEAKDLELVIRSIRDEIRCIAPGLYLGRANIVLPDLLAPAFGKIRFVTWFGLQFPEKEPCDGAPAPTRPSGGGVSGGGQANGCAARGEASCDKDDTCRWSAPGVGDPANAPGASCIDVTSKDCSTYPHRIRCVLTPGCAWSGSACKPE